jgi:hypothetical protein
MITSVARINIYSSPYRLARCLLSNSSFPPNTRRLHQSDHPRAQPQIIHYLVNFHSWRLTHQPREPTLHWNTRFREQNVRTEVEEEEQSSENWDLWFQQQQSSPLVPYSERHNSFSPDQVYFLDQARSVTMPKRSRESYSPVEIPHKREKYSPRKCLTYLLSFYSLSKNLLVDFHLPKRTWTSMIYEEHLTKSRYHHFNFHIISYNISHRN